MFCESFKYPQLMKYFEEISAIPRASYKEEAIAEYLCEFARKRGLECHRDGANNVLINIPATAGREDRPALLLQGHTDMVCEKNEGVEHDFDTEGLELYEQDGWIRARGTTLGADDGVAVAIMLCVLDGGVDAHGPIQCLFTASEEVGLDGVKSFDYSRIFARRMINMDSADESQIITGCAGGVRTSLVLDAQGEPLCAKSVATVRIGGLFGGHSGEDIDKGRANANKLMGRVLHSLCSDGARLISVCGGSKDNAIPRECVARVAVDGIERLKSRVTELESLIKKELCADDAEFSLTATVESAEDGCEVMSADMQSRAVFVMNTVANGVFDMNRNVDGVVEWSRNLGIVKGDARECSFVFSSRSSLPSRIDASTAELDAYASLLGGCAEHYNRYPGWSYKPCSPLRDDYSAAYTELYGKAPEITVIHAGLECGFISEAVPDMDIISCGPVVKDLHSPDERLDKASFERFFEVIKKVIEK